MAKRSASAGLGEFTSLPDEPGVLQCSLPMFRMTDSTTVNIAENFDDDNNENDVVDVPNPGASYDPTGNGELDELRQELNARRWDESWISQIRSAAGKKSFPLHLQFEPVEADKAFTLSLGQLAESASHETGIQYIYPNGLSMCCWEPTALPRVSNSAMRFRSAIPVTWLVSWIRTL